MTETQAVRQDSASEPGAERPIAKKRRTKRRPKSRKNGRASTARLSFPKQSISKCLRIPQAILDQNAGNQCTDKEAAKFAGLTYTGPLGVEISSAIKYGLLERPAPGTVKPTELTRRIVRPQTSTDKTEAMREAVGKAPVISEAYEHYRGENLPDLTFLGNTARETFHVPVEKVDEFVTVFLDALKDAALLEDVGGKQRVLDVTHTADEEVTSATAEERLRKVSKGVSVQSTDTCFVVMPFADPLGSYFGSIYEPAIRKAGLKAVRADADIYGTGKIIDQIWDGINSARVLVAELTTQSECSVRTRTSSCP